MTKRHPLPRSTSQHQAAQQWRNLLGPGHQFPTTNERTLGYWVNRTR
jgi:hypothetical protein